MANVYAVKSGNWSDTTVWNTGALPTSADDVYANNRTVTVDVSATVLSIRNGASSPIVAGGTFVPTNGITLTLTGSGVVNGNVTTTFVSNLTSGQYCTINGNINGGTTGSGLTNANLGTVNINGSCSAAGGSVACVNNVSSGTVIITGDCFAGSNSGGGTPYAVINTSIGTVNITGSCTAGTSAFNGNCIAVANTSTGTVTIIGTCTGGNGSTGAGSYGVVNSSSGTLNIFGTIYPGLAAAGMGPGSASQNTYLTGPFIGTAQGFVANQAIRWRWIQAVGSSYMTAVNSTATGYKNLYTADSTLSNSGQPGISSVRLGTIYGPNSELTGTLAMPLPSQVYYGVAVGNTTGTAALNVADIWNYPVSGITTSGSIGERLKTAATVNVMGQLISDSFSAK